VTTILNKSKAKSDVFIAISQVELNNFMTFRDSIKVALKQLEVFLTIETRECKHVPLDFECCANRNVCHLEIANQKGKLGLMGHLNACFVIQPRFVT